MFRPHLTTDDLAARLNVSPEMIRVLCRSGDLPHVRVGRLYRFDLDEVEAWIERRRVHAAEVRR
jgi:excisionase family DNA binding protein